MSNRFSREELLIGKDNIEKLNNSKVCVFGLGGVGSYVVEALARAGIENFILVDKDIVEKSNINRQLIALDNTIGKDKVEVSKERILLINKNAKVEIRKEFFGKDSEDFFDNSIDYIVDAIDTITSKIEIIKRAKEKNIKIISSMGTGNKLDPTKFEVSNISKTSYCPLAKILRKELSKLGIKDLKVIYSKEEIIKQNIEVKYNEDGKREKIAPGSISFVPSVAGLIIAGEVIKDIIGINKK